MSTIDPPSKEFDLTGTTMGYLVATKTVLTQSLKRVFDGEYPDDRFRNLHIDMEYPINQQDYPGVWVNFTPEQGGGSPGGLRPMNLGNAPEITVEGDEEATRSYRRWKFGGMATYTIGALSSLERDSLFDHLVALIAFGVESQHTAQYRNYIESNPWVALHINWDAPSQSGFTETPGTPWNTEDIVYEATVGLMCHGEFVSDGADATLVRLEEIRSILWPEGDPDPAPGDDWR